MKTYAIAPAYIRRKLRQAFLLVSVLSFPIPVAMPFFMGLASDERTRPMLIPLIVATLVLTFSGIIFGVVMQQRILSSYRITLEGYSIIRSQLGVPDLVIEQEEVTEVMETPGGGLVIRASDPQRNILVPAGLERYGELRTLLGNLQEIRTLPKSTVRRQVFLGAALLVVMLGGFPLVLLSSNRYLVAPVGLLVIGVTLWSFVQMQRSPEVSRWVKLSSWLFFVGPFPALIVRVVQVLSQ